MNVWVTARTSDEQFWRSLRSLVRAVNQAHIPVTGLTRAIFSALYGAHVFTRETIGRTLRFVWYEPLFRSRCDRVGQRFEMEQLPYITGSGRIVIGSDVRLSGKSSIGFGNRVHARPELLIGDNTFVGHNCAFSVAESITIGSHCLLAYGVRVSDFDGHPIDSWERRSGASITASSVRRVVIGDDVWIGTHAQVLKGVRIGARSIIGAGAIVTKDIPPDVIAAGNPARVIRSFSPQARSDVERAEE